MHKWDDARIFKRSCQFLVKLGLKVSYVATSEVPQKLKGLDFYPLKPRRGLRRRLISSYKAYVIASKINADIYHFHDPDLIPWMFLLRLQKKKVIYDIHENFHEKFYHYSSPANQFLGFLYGVYELPIRVFSGIITVSESLRQLYAKKAKRSCVVMNVPPKSALPSIKSSEKSTVPLIYISGQQSKKRNCTEMVEALPQIKKTYPNVKLMLVGRFVPELYEQELIEKAKALGVEKNLVIEGMLPWEENFTRTAKATLGCVFYEDNPNNRVGVPNRLFEYMACGVPILAENFIELQRITNDAQCGLLVDSSKPVEIANAALEMLSNQDRAMNMGQKGKEAVFQKYNFEEEVKKMLNFYEEILSENE